MFLVTLPVVFGLISSALATAPCPTYTPKFFTQQLYHSSDNNATFQQQYQLVTDFFQPGGPILYTISPETSVMQCVERSAFLDFAQELGAIVAVLEHRFFGDSFPSGVNDSNATPADFAPLTLENVILDSVTFVNWIKSTVSGANNSKIIVQGGSYAGFLATEARLRYPETFYGAMPSAPPLKSLGPLQSNPYKYNWFEWVSQVYEDQSFEASAKIRTAVQVFGDCVTAHNCTQIVSEMNPCAPEPPATAWAQLLLATIVVYEYAVQLSYAIPYIWPSPHPYQVIANQTLQANSTAGVLRIPNILFNNQSSSACWNWTATLENYANPVHNGQRAFQWILCNYFPASATAIENSTSSLFPPRDVISICPNASWEPSYYNNSNQWWVEHLGITDEALRKAGRILFTRDGAEQTSSVGAPLWFEGLKGRNETRTIQVWGLSHTEDLFGQAVEPLGLNPSLDYIRNVKLQYLKAWQSEDGEI